jgi:retinol dehydrogenase-12
MSKRPPLFYYHENNTTHHTSGATGIGKETALQLLSHNATVYIASRSRSKFDDLVAESSTKHRTQHLCFLSLDLSSMVSCVEAAREFLSKEKRLDVVVANAAVSVVVCI